MLLTYVRRLPTALPTDEGRVAGNPPFSGQASLCPPGRLTGEFIQRNRRLNRQMPADVVVLGPGLTTGHPPFYGQSLTRPPGRWTGEARQRNLRRNRQMPPDVAVLGPGLSYHQLPYPMHAQRPPNRPTGALFLQNRRLNWQMPSLPEVLGPGESAGHPPFHGQQVPPRVIGGHPQLARRYRETDVIPVPLTALNLTAGHPPFYGQQVPPRITIRLLRQMARHYRQSDVIAIIGPHLAAGHPPFHGQQVPPRVTPQLLRQLARHYRETDVIPVPLTELGLTAGHPPFYGQSSLCPPSRLTGEFIQRNRRHNWPSPWRGPSVPDAPTLEIASDTDLEVVLSWTAPATGPAITGYQIERESPIGGGFSILVADTGSTATTYTDTTADPDTQYNYRVSSIGSLGVGGTSNDAATTTLSAITVDAGPDIFILNGLPADLSGSYSVDPDAPPETITSTVWSQVAGPGLTTFGNANDLTTTATFSEPGAYTLGLTVSSDTDSDTGYLTVYVEEVIIETTSPVNTDFGVATPISAVIVAHPGIPPGTRTRATWSVVSGPGAVTFTNPRALTTTAIFTAPGVYFLVINVTLGLATESGEVIVFVGNPQCPCSGSLYTG